MLTTLPQLTVLPSTHTIINFATVDGSGQDDDHDLKLVWASGNIDWLFVEKLDRRRFKLISDNHQDSHTLSVRVAATDEEIAILPVSVDDRRVLGVSYTVEP